MGGAEGLERENRIKELEQEVARSNEVALRLQKELSEANAKLTAASGAPANVKKQTQLTEGVRKFLIFARTFIHPCVTLTSFFKHVAC